MKIVSILLLFTQIFSQSIGISIVFDGEKLMEIDRSNFESVLGKELPEHENLEQLMSQINEQIYKEPINATINENGGIVAEEAGHKLDEKRFREQFYRSFFKKGPATIDVPIVGNYPRVDSELLSRIRVKRIGQFTTYFNSRKKARAQNISLATEAINNHVVFPGEVFSFNEVVGKRTKEKGYLPAPIIIKGKIYQDFGGGICQVSSTLYNAADKAGLQIVQRHSHSKPVPYVPPGRDANVSWYGSDFMFKNTYNQPILIRAKAHGGALMILIESSDEINKDTP
ncbi:VanW family protein [Bacillus sp. FJAT-45350]|uniref:VanW family protein n=1 Tax=Bacillus sp. FJAT-45350 TaxID=2011014 RepID=UPI000BB7E130|nr:VanW family protein [Bacillus sp. FJAT-45350]